MSKSVQRLSRFEVLGAWLSLRTTFLGIFFALLLAVDTFCCSALAQSLTPPPTVRFLSDLIKDSAGNVTIPKGFTTTIDPGNFTFDFNRITIDSGATLKCPDTGTSQISAKFIEVNGDFICGRSSREPFTGAFTITLKKGLEPSHNRGIMVHGRLVMHGVSKTNFVRLGQTLSVDRTARSKPLVFNKSVDGWATNDRLRVSSTSPTMSPFEAESVILERIGSSGFGTRSVINFQHNGEIVCPPNDTPNSVNRSICQRNPAATLDDRAFVVNLDRNIKILGDNGNVDSDGGVHIMAMKAPTTDTSHTGHHGTSSSGSIQLDSVQIENGGVAGEMGKYPVHWHLLGNTSDQYIRNSVITNSAQRCIVIHGTNGVNVINNACIGHRGHGIFLQNGSEYANIITDNIVLDSKEAVPGKHLLRSEIAAEAVSRRWAGPASSGFQTREI